MAAAFSSILLIKKTKDKQFLLAAMAAPPESSPMAPSPSPAPPPIVGALGANPSTDIFQQLLDLYGQEFMDELASLSDMPSLYPSNTNVDHKALRQAMAEKLEPEHTNLARRLKMPALKTFTKKLGEYASELEGFKAQRDSLAKAEKDTVKMAEEVEERKTQLAKLEEDLVAKRKSIEDLRDAIERHEEPVAPAFERDADYVKERFVEFRVKGGSTRLKNPTMEQAIELVGERFTATTTRRGETLTKTFPTESGGWPELLAKAGSCITLVEDAEPFLDGGTSDSGSSDGEGASPPPKKRPIPQDNVGRATRQKTQEDDDDTDAEGEPRVGDIVVHNQKQYNVAACDAAGVHLFYFHDDGRADIKVVERENVELTEERCAYITGAALLSSPHTPAFTAGSTRTRW